MWVIRALTALLFAALIILIDLPLHLITSLIEKAKPGSCTEFRHSYARFAMQGIWLLAGGKAIILGLKNVPTDRAVLFVGNHRSIFDIILAGSLIRYPVGFVAKKELKGTPITMIMEEIHCLFLDREDFHAGSFKIATKAKVPVIPVTIVGMGDVFEDHFPRPKRATVVIEFGEPIETADMDRNAQKELPDRVKAIIEETYARDKVLINGK